MAQVKSLKGGKVGVEDLDDTAFGEPAHPVAVREAVLMYQANLRQGTAKAKSRGEVRGSTKKLYRQKHTGRARHGDKKAPQFRKGGVAHPPLPRDYRQSLPRKALRRALGTVLSRKLADGEVLRWDSPTMAKPSTKSARQALLSLEAGRGALLVAAGPVDRNLLLSIRNLPGIRALPAAEVTSLDVAAHRRLVLLDGAFEALVERVHRTGKGGHAHEARKPEGSES
jgi:large subunit ribosomal protein L4